MKKILSYFMFVLVTSLPTMVFALECKDVFGVWKGSLGGLSNVRFGTSSFGDPWQDAEVSFVNHGASTTVGMIRGSCQKNTDGSLSLVYIADRYGVNLNINAKLTNKKMLEVTLFNYYTPLDRAYCSGTLTREE